MYHHRRYMLKNSGAADLRGKLGLVIERLGLSVYGLERVIWMKKRWELRETA